MKILQVSSSFKPSWEKGGVARSAYEISKSLSQKGHDVTVYTTDQGEKRLNVKVNKPVDVDGIKTYYFENLSNSLAMGKKILTPYYAPMAVKKDIKNFDLIHIHSYRTTLVATVSHYARKYDVPYVVQPRGSAQKENKSLQKTIFDYIVGYKVLREAEKIILSSQNEYELSKSILKKTGIKKEEISYIPNGININESSFDERNFRDKYDIKNEEKIILYLGRISERKGLDMLIKAFENIADKEDDHRLVIVGPKSSYIKELKSIINQSKVKNKILLPGPLYEGDKYAAYSAADVFVLPSKDQQESFGNVVLEAAGCGTPCVATNVCGVTEWMDNVIMVNPDTKSIRRGIEKGLKAKELGEESREEVIEKLSWDAIVKNELIPIYENVKN